MKITKSPARIREVVDDVVMTLTPMASDKQLRLSASYEEPVPTTVELDAFRLRQVLLNLIGNAIKFTAKGEVRVVIRWREGNLMLAVHDTGPGMSAQTLERIFIPFQQGSDNTQHQYGGTGLGLAISRNICELMGGSLGVESEVGRGSVFYAEFKAPQCEDVVAPAVPAEPKPTAAPNLAGNILLAEDNDDIRELVTRLLSKMGLTVHAVANGQAAVQRAFGDNVDIVLMDMEMPVQDGLSATKELRNRGFTQPILAMTAHPEGPEVERALQEGFDGYLEKPVNRERLHRLLTEMLRTQRNRPLTTEARSAA